MILSCWALRYGRLDSLNIKIRLQIAEKFLVPFLATKEAVAPPENNLIMSGTSIWSFKHLEHQNPSIISEDIGRARSVQQFRIGGGGGGGSEEEYSCLRGYDKKFTKCLFIPTITNNTVFVPTISTPTRH